MLEFILAVVVLVCLGRVIVGGRYKGSRIHGELWDGLKGV